jgi:nucleoid-associated protein YgaU
MVTRFSQQTQVAVLTGPSQSGDAQALAGGGPIAPGSQLRFQFNPGKVKITRSVKTEGATSVQATNLQDAVVNSGNLVITLDEVRLAGPSTMANANLLLLWTVPVQGVSAESITTENWGVNARGVPVLRFAWGSGLSYSVILSSVTINYSRFLATGVPIRADCSITMQDYPVQLTKTNPTSGGLPGRQQHVVIAGDSMVRIAQQVYGRPRCWRDIADANGIDDPLRLRLGQRLFLPGPDELRGRDRT